MCQRARSLSSRCVPAAGIHQLVLGAVRSGRRALMVERCADAARGAFACGCERTCGGGMRLCCNRVCGHVSAGVLWPVQARAVSHARSCQRAIVVDTLPCMPPTLAVPTGFHRETDRGHRVESNHQLQGRLCHGRLREQVPVSVSWCRKCAASGLARVGGTTRSNVLPTGTSVPRHASHTILHVLGVHQWPRPCSVVPRARRAYACAVNFPKCLSDGSFQRPCKSMCTDYCDACFVSTCPCSDMPESDCFTFIAPGGENATPTHAVLGAVL